MLPSGRHQSRGRNEEKKKKKQKQKALLAPFWHPNQPGNLLAMVTMFKH
jgi:hypothetical protein